MNTLTSDMASFPIPPLGSHWFHESDLIGDLFDLTICITTFRCPNLMESASALVHSECDYFKMYQLVSKIYMHVCLRAGSHS